MTDPTGPPTVGNGQPSWQVVASTAAIGIVLMVLAGGLLAPLGRLFVGAVYGIVEGTVLRPFGFAVPGIVSFVLVNVVMLATSFAAGRRVGAIVAFRSVERQLGSNRLLYGITLVSGLAGIAAFAAAVPWSGEADGLLPPGLQVVYGIFGYVLYLVVLLVGPTYGARRYLVARPHCPRCWVWLERETGGGSFLLADLSRLTAALLTREIDVVRDLPLADASLPREACSLRWWSCPTCRSYSLVRCVTGESDSEPAALVAIELTNQPIEDVRAVIAHRRALADTRPRRPEPSAARRG